MPEFPQATPKRRRESGQCTCPPARRTRVVSARGKSLHYVTGFNAGVRITRAGSFAEIYNGRYRRGITATTSSSVTPGLAVRRLV